jgi:hypothetical protein
MAEKKTDAAIADIKSHDKCCGDESSADEEIEITLQKEKFVYFMPYLHQFVKFLGGVSLGVVSAVANNILASHMNHVIDSAFLERVDYVDIDDDSSSDNDSEDS